MARSHPIVRADGLTSAERYLKRLCDRTFLSLWSYSGVQVRDADGLADELADLLVVFENDIIIFSDKEVAFKSTQNLPLDWSRWFRRAVMKGAKQLWGAERRLRSRPSLFLDAKCTQPFPLELPDPEAARFHLVLVTHGGSKAAAAALGGSGSFNIHSELRGFSAHTEPFTIGDLDPSRPFIHVLDDTSLDILLGTRDTVADFRAYLTKRAGLLRSRVVLVPGEEELLAAYFNHVDTAGEHDFVPPHLDPFAAVVIESGLWFLFKNGSQRRTQLEHDRISYSWDQLIETFSYYALRGDEYLGSPSLPDRELIMRFLAREPRTRRRMLADSLFELIARTPLHMRGKRVVAPSSPGDPYYAFLVLPVPDDLTHETYRRLRGGTLDALMRVVRLVYPDAVDIVGIATETGLFTEPRTEDAGYLDTRDWCAAMEADAIECQQRLGLLVNTVARRSTVHEFPVASLSGELLVPPPPNPRNKPCPCGSGRKYKRCHAP